MSAETTETFESELRAAHALYQAVTKTALQDLRQAEQALETQRRRYNKVLDREAKIYQQTVADLKAKYIGFPGV